ncbi:MAG TPA: flippase activity-associated protein Agl23 [Candidatus Sulfobium mesophilum]|nr:flippase activity-associated protein Agl23 [Candidatus Sulfobium mesophilum]
MRGKDRLIGWLILLTSFILCFAGLSLKPPHPDEGGNGFFVNQIWENGFYIYDPQNYHGPLLFYLFQISEKIFGFGIGSFRLVTALFSTLSVWLILRSRDFWGRYTAFFAAAALALSPGMIFFGRSAIHESAFVFFQILLVTGFLRTKENADRKGIIWSFAGLLGCVLLKETFVILIFSLMLAWGWSDYSHRIVKQMDRKAEFPPALSLKPADRSFLLKIFFVCVFVWLAFFTGFFHHLRGARDFFTALMPWLKTGVGGSGHDKPFAYWLGLFGRYEWAALLGLFGAFAGLFGRSWKMRFISAFGIVDLLVYSLISYKTPWCIITILWPFVVAAALWIEFIFTRRRDNTVYWLSWCAVAVIAGQSATSSVRLNFIHYTDPSEPYVYVQTKTDLKDIEDLIKIKITSAPDAQNMRVQINMNDAWPLPWLFSRFPNVGFGDFRKAFAEKGDVIFAEVTHEDKDSEGQYWGRVMALRDARAPIVVYLKKSFFQGINLPGFGPSGVPEDRGT